MTKKLLPIQRRKNFLFLSFDSAHGRHSLPAPQKIPLKSIIPLNIAAEASKEAFLVLQKMESPWRGKE
jgi:hypothetical protein